MEQLNEKSFDLEVIKFCTLLIKKFIFMSCYTKYMFGTHLKLDCLISIYKSKKNPCFGIKVIMVFAKKLKSNKEL
jgi:hypothetical protein